MQKGVGLVLTATLMAAFGMLAAPASAELRQASVYKQNPVKGTTAAAVWQYMLAHPIIDPDDGPAFANITHDHKLTFKTKTEGGACKVTDLVFQWNFVITLPKAVDYGGMNGATQKIWSEFTTYLKAHEEHHRTIFLDCGKVFVPAAEKMTGLPGCPGLDGKVRNYVQRQYDLCMKKQRDFDHAQKSTVANLSLVKAAVAAKLPAGGGF
jgi:predicted secreted Zn-dependent protease